MSMRRTPSASIAGTITREPTSGDGEPASTTTTVAPWRTIVHRPLPSANRVASRHPECPATEAWRPAHGAAITADSRHIHPRSRIRLDGAAHAAEAARMHATASHRGMGDPLPMAGTAREADSAVHASIRAPAAATAPAQDPAAGLACDATIDTTPATVVIAAGIIVTTLSGAAIGDSEPPCAIAIGVVTDHATTAAHPAVHAQPPTIVAASCAADNGTKKTEQHERTRSVHRLVMGGAIVRSASTAPWLSWNPAPRMHPMSIAIATSAAAPSTPTPRTRPPRRPATAPSAAPNPARSTLVSGSVTARKPTATATAMQDRHVDRRPTAREAATAAATRTATLKPLIASTWLIPAARKSAAWRPRPGRRVPTVIAATSARSPSVAHPGIESPSPRCNAPRVRTNHAPGQDAPTSATRCAEGTSMTTVGSRALQPGFSRGSWSPSHPRTRTQVPRPGSGANPATRTTVRASAWTPG